MAEHTSAQWPAYSHSPPPNISSSNYKMGNFILTLFKVANKTLGRCIIPVHWGPKKFAPIIFLSNDKKRVSLIIILLVGKLESFERFGAKVKESLWRGSGRGSGIWQAGGLLALSTSTTRVGDQPRDVTVGGLPWSRGLVS